VVTEASRRCLDTLLATDGVGRIPIEPIATTVAAPLEEVPMSIPPVTRHRAATALVLTLVFALFAAALAQQTRTLGTIEGLLGGEERTWYALDYGGTGDVEPTATVTDFGFGMLQISLTANLEQRFMVEGSLMIDISVMGELDCPCVFDDADVVWWSSSSMFRELYVSDAPGRARVTVTRWEQVDEGVFALEGEIEAELVFLEGIGSEPDADRTLRLEATIRIDEVHEEAF